MKKINRRNFLKVSGLVLLSGVTLSQPSKSDAEYKYKLGDDVPEFYDTYVATPDFNDKRIISSNKNPSITIKEAKKRGFNEPVVIYYSDPKTIAIY